MQLYGKGGCALIQCEEALENLAARSMTIFKKTIIGNNNRSQIVTALSQCQVFISCET